MFDAGSRNSKPIVIVVLVQRDEGGFSYWADGDVEREVKIRLEDSTLANDFEVFHVKYVPSDVMEAARATQPTSYARGYSQHPGREVWR